MRLTRCDVVVPFRLPVARILLFRRQEVQCSKLTARKYLKAPWSMPLGVESEDGDWFGVVVEFDEDDDSLVIVKSEDDDEEYEVEWDSLFMPDDD